MSANKTQNKIKIITVFLFIYAQEHCELEMRVNTLKVDRIAKLLLSYIFLVIFILLNVKTALFSVIQIFCIFLTYIIFFFIIYLFNT